MHRVKNSVFVLIRAREETRQRLSETWTGRNARMGPCASADTAIQSMGGNKAMIDSKKRIMDRQVIAKAKETADGLFERETD